MRVRSIRFKNLNSLVGEWAVDFTDPVIRSEGLIAITGPTGAGKSTILDAISLALYGRTPRLSSINQSGNEIMSRRTGECFAEVCFETPAGGFRCHWSQRRAKGRPDGRLQPQKHELADAESGQILASKIQDVADKVSLLTGMDFDRFTRTMFLAQGNFAAFLLARPDERAPILEQITGTEIYSEISKRVHERYVHERGKLDALHMRIGAFELLSPEDEAALRRELELKKQSSSALDLALSARNDESEWLRRLAALEEDQRRLELQRESWVSRHEAYKPQREKFLRALKALELTGAHADLVSLRQEQVAESASKTSCVEELDLVRKQVEECEEDLQAAIKNFESTQAALLAARPVFRKVRELDLKIQEKSNLLKTSDQESAQARSAVKAVQDQLQQADSEARKQRQQLGTVAALLSQTKADEGLIEQYSEIRTYGDLILSIEKDLRSKQREKNNYAAKRELATKTVEQQTSILKSSVEKTELVRQEMEQIEKQRKSTLAGRELDEWNKLLHTLNDKRSMLEKCTEQLTGLHSSQQTVLRLEAQQRNALVGLVEVENLLPGKEALVRQMERNRNLLEKQLVLLNKIGSFEQERALLVPGNPCPVCGSRDHPFAVDGTPQEDISLTELNEIRMALKVEVQAVEDLKLRRLGLEKERTLAEERRKEEEVRLASYHDTLNELCGKLFMTFDLSALASQLDESQELIRQEINECTQRIDLTLALQTRLEKSRKVLNEASEAVQRAEKQLSEAIYSHRAVEESLNRVCSEEQSSRNILEDRLTHLAELLRPFASCTPTLETLSGQMKDLSTRRELWQSRQAERVRLEREATALMFKTEQLSGLLKKEEVLLDQHQAKQASLLAERDTLVEERKALFGDSDVEATEQSTTQAVTQSQEILAVVQKKHASSLREVYGLEQKIQALTVSLKSRQQNISAKQTHFTARLQAKEFADEAEYLAACLPEEERQALNREFQKLAEEDNALTGQEKQNRHLRKVEHDKRLTEETLLSLSEIIVDLQNKQRVIQQELGGILRKLQDNADTAQVKSQYLQEVEAQKSVCAKWNILHELIGSADGKKFRNFAQGLTFEMLISHANRQLRNMSDRYLLVHSVDSPLELSVIDNYQAGEIRTAKNLSGGECFIVSLALALGLSRMASRNVRVDSLFLDEGFGSLDDESLDMALESLGNLKKEGKLIVLISHVQALKERMGAHIRVSPSSGGRSRISGPGCLPSDH